ncbi:MAG: T9SS type A sorting domain-containing protein, partial [Bacteroidia bacterium]|nr:T9SS type A sorting domain-containing protein [Bacteroidia bacterium]
SDGKFTVTTRGGKIDAIGIYSATGIKVFSISDINLLPTSEIDLSDFAAGIYFIKINDREKIYSEKLLILKNPD